MSGQITALLAKLQEDADLREKLQGANDLDAAEALVQEAGFDVTKADLLRCLEEAIDGGHLELSDEELAGVAGGRINIRLAKLNERKAKTEWTAERLRAAGGMNGVGGWRAFG